MTVPRKVRLRVWWLQTKRKARVLRNRMRWTPGCEACDTIPPQPAEWKATYLKVMRGTFGRDCYYCTDCMLEDIEGAHTGGGPSFIDYARIVRLHPGRIKPSDLYYSVEAGSERDHW